MADLNKVHYRSANGRLVFEITGGTQKDVFAGIASVQEVFEAADSCGICHSTDGRNNYGIRYRVRESSKGKETFTYYELQCQNPACRARFDFGQNRDMKSLFPKRTDGEGKYLPNGGWYKYQPKQEDAA